MTQTSSDQRPRVVVLYEGRKRSEWRWITHHMPEIDWVLVPAPTSRGKIADRLGTLRAAIQAAWAGRRGALVVSLGPGLASALEIARRLLRVRTPHVTYFLNFTNLPRGPSHARLSISYRTIDRLVVSATAERQIYAEHFGLDPGRIDVVLWGVNPPDCSDKLPDGAPYVCAVGGNARDYGLLMNVAAARPHMRFIIVVRPQNLAGLDIPPNVEVRANIPFPDAMAVVKGSRVMALPLATTETPCGHVTIVAAQYLGTPIVITASNGVEDYIRDGETGLTVEAGSAEAMGAAIDRLWNDPAEAKRIADAAQAFVEAECTELNYVKHLRGLLAPQG